MAIDDSVQEIDNWSNNLRAYLQAIDGGALRDIAEKIRNGQPGVPDYSNVGNYPVIQQEIKDIVFEQYEEIRQEGVCNMFDKRCVQKFASLWDMEELETTILDGHYVEILQGYGDWKERAQ